MSEVELLPLFLDVNQDIDTQFQFWMSITFAVLVASFVADERLSRIERGVITALYRARRRLSCFGMPAPSAHQQDVLDLFTASGIPQPELPTLAGLLRLVLFTFGSLVAALSVLFPRFGAKQSGAGGKT